MTYGHIAAASFSPPEHGRIICIYQVMPMCSAPHVIGLPWAHLRPESTIQTASLPVQPFLHTSRQSTFRHAGHILSPDHIHQLAPMCPHWTLEPPVNTNEPFVCGSDAFFYQITSTTFVSLLRYSETLVKTGKFLQPHVYMAPPMQ